MVEASEIVVVLRELGDSEKWHCSLAAASEARTQDADKITKTTT